MSHSWDGLRQRLGWRPRTPNLDAFATLRAQRPALFWLCLLTGAALLVFPIAVGIGWAMGWTRFGGVDFKAYYLAGLRARHGVPLYDHGAFVDRVPKPFARRFLYPPAVAFLFVPFTYLQPALGRFAWIAGQIGVLWLGVLALVRGYDLDLSPAEAGLLLWAVLGFQPVTRVTRTANISALLAGLLCFAAAATIAEGAVADGALGETRNSRDVGTSKPDGRSFLGGAFGRSFLGGASGRSFLGGTSGRSFLGGSSGRPYLGGALTALAAVPKPFVAPAGAHLLRDRRRLAGAAVALAGVVLVGLLAFGVDAHREYLDVLRRGKGWGGGGGFGELPRKYQPLFQFPGLQLPVQGALLGGAAVTALAGGAARAVGRGRFGRRSLDDVVFALGVVAVPLVAPAANSLTLAVAVPGLLVALIVEWRRGGRPGLVVLSILLVHANHYVLRLFYLYGPTHAEYLPWKRAGATLLVLQPATLGLLLVFGLLTWRVWTGIRPGGDPTIAR